MRKFCLSPLGKFSVRDLVTRGGSCAPASVRTCCCMCVCMCVRAEGLAKPLSGMFPEPQSPGQSQYELQENCLVFDKSLSIEVGHTTGLWREECSGSQW